MIPLLLSSRANVNDQDRRGETALMEAVWKGHAKIVRYLINAGADPLLADNSGHTAVALAVMTKNGKIGTFLRKRLKSSSMSRTRIVSSSGLAKNPKGTIVSSRTFQMEKSLHPRKGEEFPFAVPHPH